MATSCRSKASRPRGQPGGPGEGSVPAKPASPLPARCPGLPAGAGANDGSLELAQLSPIGLHGGQLAAPKAPGAAEERGLRENFQK